MFRHCSLTMSESEGPGECLHKVQRFFHVAVDVINRKVNSSMLKTVPGSRKIHHLQVLAENVLATRQLSCFCGFCMSGDFANCLSAGYVEAWQTVKLKFTGPVPLLPPVLVPVSEVNPILVDHDDDHSNNDSHNLDDRIE